MLLDLISNKELGIVAVLEVFTGPQCWINFQPDPHRPEDNYTLTPTSQQFDVPSVNNSYDQKEQQYNNNTEEWM